jgi:sporulation protein YlmC with PRC-barrel domain
MLVLHKNLESVPIMSLQNGSKLGLAQNPIIDPRKMKIIAYHASGPRIHASSVIHASDIREYSPLGFIVDNADSIMEFNEDLVRLKEVANFNFSLIGKTVVDERKHKLGKVMEYTIDVDSFFIQKIHVAQSLVKNITSSNLIINRSQIIELNDKFIVVRSGSVKEPVGLMQAMNPFRKSQSSLAPDAKTLEP